MTPKKYRYHHKIEAVQWDGSNSQILWLKQGWLNNLSYHHQLQFISELSVGDWVLSLAGEDGRKGVEIRSSTDFERDYEPVDDHDDLTWPIPQPSERKKAKIVRTYAREPFALDEDLNRPQLENGWQSIETAPREVGKLLHLYVGGYHEQILASWSEAWQMWITKALMRYEGDAPTHWRYLPTPPQ